MVWPLLQPVTVKVQVSEDSAIWDPANDITIGTGPNGTGPGGATYTVDDTGSFVTIVVTIPQSATPRKFVRVKASD